MTIIQRVRDYMQANPKAKPAAIAPALGLTVKQVNYARFRIKHGHPPEPKANPRFAPRKPQVPTHDLLTVWR